MPEAILETPIVSETPAQQPELAPEPPSLVPTPKRDALFAELDNVGNPQPAKPDPKTKPPVKAETTKPEDDEEPPTKPDEEKPATEEKPGDKPKKVSPWKMVDELKKRAADLEKQLAEAGKTGLAEQEKSEFQKRIEAAEKRTKELEDEIRFVDYSKSSEYQEKYVKPLNEAWEKAMLDLGELTVEEGGIERPLNGNDVLELVSLPLAKARELAEDKFGRFADDVMSHRKEIKRLGQIQNDALAKARETGAERMKQQQETQMQQRTSIEKALAETWAKANEEIVKDEKVGKFFTPDEADPETKVRLEKGFKLVDEAFKANPMDPNLSAEERERVVRQHAAVRNRAAAFGRLIYAVSKAEQKVAALETELAQYRETEPGTTGGRKVQETGRPVGKASDRMFAQLDELVSKG